MRTGTAVLTLSFMALLAFAAAPAHAASKISAGEIPEVGIREKMGTTMPLDETLVGEDGKSLKLRDLLDKPVLLLFVYYRCPSICLPLMHELARTLDHLEGIAVGTDFRVVTISFDPSETPAIASSIKAEMLGTMNHRPPPDGWRFLTGDEGTVRRLTEAAGFKYKYDAETQSFLHATSLIFLTTGGRIVRYIGGLEFLPAQIKMAVIDATEGRERSVMKTIERLCYSYDPEGRAYVLRLNRIILGVTGVIVGAFVLFLVLSGRKRPAGPQEG